MRVPVRVQSKWWFLVAGAALGLAAGHYAGFRKPAPPAAPAALEKHAAKARGKSPTAATNAERLKAARLSQIRELSSTQDYKAREEFTNSLGSGDVPDLLAVFLADAGLEGIDWKQREMLEKAVNQWVAEDIGAALAWAANQPQPKLRRYFQKMMLGELAKTDPFNAADRGLEIEAGDAEFDATDIVSDGIRELCKTGGNERAITDLVRKTAVKDSKSSFGISQTFAEDFAHEALLNSLAEIKKQGLEFRFAPTGMLEAWAKRDAEAAHAWSIAHGKVGFEEWQDVLGGVAASSGQQASGQWFLGKYSQADEVQRKMMVSAFDDTYSEPAARMVLADALARQMPADLAGEFVDQVLKEHLSTISGKEAEGLSLLNWYSSPDERADVLVKHAGYGGVDKLLERFPESRLAPYAVTRASLEAAIQRWNASDER
jgi:hypothetical protein